MKCSKCDSIIPDDSKFCEYCGERVSEPIRMIFCRECGKPMSNNLTACPECGKKRILDNTTSNFQTKINPIIKARLSVSLILFAVSIILTFFPVFNIFGYGVSAHSSNIFQLNYFVNIAEGGSPSDFVSAGFEKSRSLQIASIIVVGVCVVFSVIYLVYYFRIFELQKYKATKKNTVLSSLPLVLLSAYIGILSYYFIELRSMKNRIQSFNVTFIPYIIFTLTIANIILNIVTRKTPIYINVIEDNNINN